MSPFDFVCAFYSVVLGVAVAQLMTSVGRLLEVRDQVPNLLGAVALGRYCPPVRRQQLVGNVELS